MSEQPKVNTSPPVVRCYMGHRCRWDGPRWIHCSRCSWSSSDSRRVGLLWRLRVLVGR